MGTSQDRPARRAADPATPGDVLIQLAQGAAPEVRAALARNPNAPPALLWRLAVSNAGDVLANAALPFLLLENPGLHLEIPRHALTALLRHADAPLDLLATCAHHPDAAVRETVAMSSRTPPDVLEQLADDPVEHLRQRVALNPSTPAHVLERLASGGAALVAVAGNRRAPVDLLLAFATLRDKRTLTTLAHNPGVPAYVLDRLARSRDAHIREAVAASRAASYETLLRLAHDDEQRVRIAVANNPDAPARCRARLQYESAPRSTRA